MVNAVVLAGGKDKTTAGDVAGWILFNIPYLLVYHKIKIPGSYKSFMKVGGEIEGVYKRRPSLEYILNALDKSNIIEKVAIVTNPKKFEEKLDVSIKNYMSKCTVVQQVGSIMQNAMEGYKALNEKGHTLFIAGDSPQTTKENIEEFWGKSIPYLSKYSFIYPFVSRETHHKYDKIFRRLYFGIYDDTTKSENISDAAKKRRKKKNARITSMSLVNPEDVGNKEMIDYLYDIRNIAAPQNWVRAYRIFKEEIKKILSDNLTFYDVERKMSYLMETRFKVLELGDARSSLDLDDIGDDKRIEIVNGYNAHIKHNS